MSWVALWMKASRRYDMHTSSPQIYITALKSNYLNDCVNFFFPEHPLQKLSLGRARELSVHTARLPIDEYMVKKNNAKNFHSKILAVNQGELTVPICKTSENVINMNIPFPLSLSSSSVWYFAETLRHRQLDRGPASMVPPSQGLCCSISYFSTATSFSNISSTRGQQSDHHFIY